MTKIAIFVFLVVKFSSSISAWELKQATQPLNHVEGPHWDETQNVLFYVDILGRLVLRYDPATGERTQVAIDGDTTPVLRVEGTTDGFVVGRGRDLISFKWNGRNNSGASDVRVLASVDQDKPSNKMNDGKADTEGRIWSGTIVGDNQFGNAGFYFFDRKNNFNPVKKLNATTSNGLAWTADSKKMYYIDSPTQNVDVFDYNSITAEISNRRHLFNPADYNLGGVPDGMTLDADGNLWVAVWGGNAVAYVNATNGNLIQKYELPANQVSSCVWGGENMDTLFITTSRQGYGDEDIAKYPQAGSVFALTNTGIKGQKTNNDPSSESTKKYLYVSAKTNTDSNDFNVLSNKKGYKFNFQKFVKHDKYWGV